MFVLLREHAANIANVLTLRVNPSVWFGVCDWLMVAASVGKVELNTSKFNQSYGYCSSADWAAAGFEDTLLRWNLKPEVGYGNETAIQPGVQA